MLDWTTRHCRVFHRILTKNALLYTEMITTGAILYGKYDHLYYNKIEHPIALQLGGSSPKDLALCAKKAEEYGYDEINLNVGCPSDRVQNGAFGACLMKEPDLVAECIAEMKLATKVPVTVKTRLGIDELDSYEFLTDFISKVHQIGGCNHFIIHARKAWLSGLSPKENREVPPLDYERVYRLKRDFPDLTIIINGGLSDLNIAHDQLNYVDGVMLGREAYQNPSLLLHVDSLFFGESPVNPSNLHALSVEKIRSLYPYIENELSQGNKLGHITRHMVGLFQGAKGAKLWRRYLSENAHKENSGIEVLVEALKYIQLD
ncbi:tRNA-dihydrouridine synthase A [Thorsellia anophelis DSM 18579]|uniref:tRNA-dihydrouridine(20/20a) synthase n=2 Tax=Thorsellia anophelis TaxID=336804 RepID=A0A1H9YBX9_9GAMM|nr:tRNA-dihydrouridine synthase A [Thorsellia anophelis DSM 18579]